MGDMADLHAYYDYDDYQSSLETCVHCGVKNLEWNFAKNKWFLVTKSGRRHKCRKKGLRRNKVTVKQARMIK